MSGYGEDGPYAHRPGQDLLLQAMSGALESVGRSGDTPQPAGQFLVDGITAYVAFEGALAALLHRERTGEGQLVQVNMLDAILTLQMQELSIYTVGGPRADALGRAARALLHPLAVRHLRDAGRAHRARLPVAAATSRSCSTRRSSPASTTRSTPGSTATRSSSVTQERLLTGKSADWLAAFEAQGCWAGPVYGYEDVLDDAQVEHNGTFVDYDHPTEGAVRTPGIPDPLLAHALAGVRRRAADRRAQPLDPRRARPRRPRRRRPDRPRGRRRRPRCDGVPRADLGSPARLRVARRGSASARRRRARDRLGHAVARGLRVDADPRARAHLRPDRARPPAPRRGRRGRLPRAGRRAARRRGGRAHRRRRRSAPRRRATSTTAARMRCRSTPRRRCRCCSRRSSATARRRRPGTRCSRSRPSTRSRSRSPARTRC